MKISVPLALASAEPAEPLASPSLSSTGLSAHYPHTTLLKRSFYHVTPLPRNLQWMRITLVVMPHISIQSFHLQSALTYVFYFLLIAISVLSISSPNSLSQHSLNTFFTSQQSFCHFSQNQALSPLFLTGRLQFFSPSRAAFCTHPTPIFLTPSTILHPTAPENACLVFSPAESW